MLNTESVIRPAAPHQPMLDDDRAAIAYLCYEWDYSFDPDHGESPVTDELESLSRALMISLVILTVLAIVLLPLFSVKQ